MKPRSCRPGILTVTINRPDKLNALNPEVMEGLAAAFESARDDDAGRALEMLLTGDMVSADEAWRIGLVNRVGEPAELLSACREILKKILAKAPVAIRYVLDAVNAGLEMPFAAAEDHEATLFGLTFATEDMKEGVSAFLEKRPPKFTGK